MKVIAYTIYVVTILLISGLSRANAGTLSSLASTQAQYQSPLQIMDVAASPEQLQITIDGRAPSLCYGNPSVILIQSEENPQVLTIHLSSPAPTSPCVSQVKYFETTLNLATLAQVSRLQLQANVTYLVKIEGYQFAMQVPGSQLIN